MHYCTQNSALLAQIVPRRPRRDLLSAELIPVLCTLSTILLTPLRAPRILFHRTSHIVQESESAMRRLSRPEPNPQPQWLAGQRNRRPLLIEPPGPWR